MGVETRRGLQLTVNRVYIARFVSGRSMQRRVIASAEFRRKQGGLEFVCCLGRMSAAALLRGGPGFSPSKV